MTYPDAPEPTEAELEQHQEERAEAYVWVCPCEDSETCSECSPQDPIPEVSLEDGGSEQHTIIVDDHSWKTPEIMEALLGASRNALRRRIWQDVLDERCRQLKKWGDQTRPLGASYKFSIIADIHRENCDEAEASGTCTWRHIAFEEAWEAFSESNRDAFRKEAVQTIAVLVSALEDLYRDEFQS